MIGGHIEWIQIINKIRKNRLDLTKLNKTKLNKTELNRKKKFQFK